MDNENMTIMDELFSSRAKSSQEKYQAIKDQVNNWCIQQHSSVPIGDRNRIIEISYDIAIVDLCLEQLSSYIYPGWGDCNEKLLDYFYKMSLTDSIPHYFLDCYMDSDLSIADATDQLVDKLIEDISDLEDEDEDEGVFEYEN